ncbi:unnamed protein product [Phaeothamnion confervicola]
MSFVVFLVCLYLGGLQSLTVIIHSTSCAGGGLFVRRPAAKGTSFRPVQRKRGSGVTFPLMPRLYAAGMGGFGRRSGPQTHLQTLDFLKSSVLKPEIGNLGELWEVGPLKTLQLSEPLRKAVAITCTVRPRKLPPFPFRLEPNTHCYVSNKSCDDIVGCLEQCFTDGNVDAEYEADGCFWQCARFGAGVFVELRVTVYRCDGERDGQLCVEFRLSRGDRFEFRRVYQGAISALGDAGCCLDLARAGRRPNAAVMTAGMPLARSALAPNAVPLFGAAPVPVPAAAAAGAREEMDLSPLLGMVSDCCCDVNYEGARLIAQLTATEENRDTLARGDVVLALVALVIKGVTEAAAAIAAAGAGDAQAPPPQREPKQQPLVVELGAGAGAAVPAKRCKLGPLGERLSPVPEPSSMARAFAVFALSNLSERVDCQQIIAGSPDMLPSLLRLASCGCGGPSYVELEERRECARLLANLAGPYGKEMAENVAKGGAPVRDFVMRCDGLPDDRLKMHASRVRRLLADAPGGVLAC